MAAAVPKIFQMPMLACSRMLLVWPDHRSKAGGPQSAQSSFPGEHRLLQLGDAGVPARQHFAELVDQGRGRGVDVATGVAKPDHAAPAFRNGSEIECVLALDGIERNAVNRG